MIDLCLQAAALLKLNRLLAMTPLQPSLIPNQEGFVASDFALVDEGHGGDFGSTMKRKKQASILKNHRKAEYVVTPLLVFSQWFTSNPVEEKGGT